MNTLLPFRMCLVGMLCLSLQAAGKVVQDEDVLTINRPWLHEREFSENVALHATRNQTVVLHLEDAGRKGNPIVRNALRFTVDEAENFSFCIPAGDPHLVRLKLKRNGGPTLLNGHRGGDCKAIHLDPGRYTLDIYHDSREVPVGGKLAFLHVPEQPRLLGNNSTLLSGDASSGQPDFMAFKAENGKWVSGQSSDNYVKASESSVWDTEIWIMSQIKDQKYSLAYDDPSFKIMLDGPVTALQPVEGNAWLHQFPFGTKPILAQFIFHDQGGWNFTLDTYWVYVTAGGSSDSAVQPVIRDPGTNQLYLGPNNPSVYETFTATLKGFDCSNGCDSGNLPLSKGEVALISECNYQGIGAVSITNVERFAAFDVPTKDFNPQPQIVRSIRLGPGTFLELYPKLDFGGTLTGISADQACLSPAASVASFKRLTNAKNFIIQTNSCVNCTLTGIDLSGLDLSEGVFTGSSFLQANLTGTDFTGATMNGVDLSASMMTATVFDDALLTNASLTSGNLGNATFRSADLTNAVFRATADLVGTDFSSGAILHCTSFENSDVTAAVFDSTPDIKRDFSCRLDLTDATLDFTTFALADWPYLNLSTSNMSNVPDPLSSLSTPLNLAGINLSGVKKWLAGKTLDGVNLGCASVQTIDIDAKLNGGSQSNPVQVTLGAGTWVVTPAKGLYTSWNAWGSVSGCSSDGAGCTNGWLNEYEYWSVSVPLTRVSSDDRYETETLALARARPSSFTLDQEEVVNFTLTDSVKSLSDNLGGTTLHLTSTNALNGCSAGGGAKVCSTLQGTVLSSASLKQACLSGASMEGAFLSFSNLDGADMSGVQLQALVGGKAATLEGAFMRNVSLSGANLTGVRAQNVNFYPAEGGTADATGLTAPGADFSGAYLAFADFSGAGSLADLQSTTWTGAMLLGANFSQTDLSTNTSGGVNSGTNTTFEGAYMQGTLFENGTILDDVDFSNTYWDAAGAGGSLNLLLPKQNLEFAGYWKDIDLPECPQTLTWSSGTPPPMGVTKSDNTCPDTLPGPCDSVWDSPKIDISLAFFQSASPGYPRDPTVQSDLQCSGKLSDPNPYDLCWTIATEPPPAQCVPGQ